MKHYHELILSEKFSYNSHYPMLSLRFLLLVVVFLLSIATIEVCASQVPQPKQLVDVKTNTSTELSWYQSFLLCITFLFLSHVTKLVFQQSNRV